jgi:acyl-CoA reductase-like NAD-dependent aldehyde dehydrogenase
LLGNVVVWKPSDSALHASWLLYQILREAGLPKDVIQFLPGDAEQVTNTILKLPSNAAGPISVAPSAVKLKGAMAYVNPSSGRYSIWKPSDSALHASWLLYQILREAGLPKDVIQFLPGSSQLA